MDKISDFLHNQSNLAGEREPGFHNIRLNYPNAWRRYGFVDAFNPARNWYNPDVIGINQGITMLMAENARTRFVWNTFMKNAEIQDAMTKVGFRPA